MIETVSGQPISATSATLATAEVVTERSEALANVSMAKHIRVAHGVRVGADAAADVIVSETNEMVTVRLSDDLLSRAKGNCLTVLRFSGPEKTLAKPEYVQFLDQLHAYLTFTPLQSRAGGAAKGKD